MEVGAKRYTVIIEDLFLKANFIVNPVLQKTLDSPVILKSEIIRRAFQEGLYYVTDNDNADKIMEESMIHSPEPILSYGLKKPIFYGGVPDFSVSCIDLKLPKVFIAIKMTIPYETLALFQMEKASTYYKLYYPNFLVEEFDLKKVFYGLTTKEQKFCYQEIKEEDALNYQVQIPLQEVKQIEKNLATDLKEKLKEIKKLGKQLKFT